MEFDVAVKLAIFRHFAETGGAPTIDETAARTGSDPSRVAATYAELRAQRVLVLATDGRSIRMAPPFSGVPTQHIVESGGVRYFANCAWDALGIPAALQQPATVRSECAQSGEPLTLDVGTSGPGGSEWVFHCLVPAAKWWEDIVFT